MINLSYSALSDFSLCPQRWKYAYVDRLTKEEPNLAPEAGTCLHVGLRAFYMKEDWERAIREWAESAYENFVPQAPTPLPGALTLDTEGDGDDDDDLITSVAFDPRAMVEKTVAVMNRYIAHYPEDSEWEVLEAEKRFEIPFPEWGVNFVGVLDMIARDGQGNEWIWDHKFPLAPSGFRDSEDLELDLQIGIYQWIARQFGYHPIGFKYNQILNELPKLPRLLTRPMKGRRVSVQDILTTWDTYAAFLTEVGENPDDYRDEMLPKLSTKEFFRRTTVYRPPVEEENFARILRARIQAFAQTYGNVYPVPSRPACRMCDFKPLCLEWVRGNDLGPMIASAYKRRERS